MNILIVNQSIIDMCVSFITLLTAVFEVDGTRIKMSRDSIYGQFVCRIWISRAPLWSLLVTSTYGILMVAFERYVAVLYPVWYNVRNDQAYHSHTVNESKMQGRFYFRDSLVVAPPQIQKPAEKM